MVELDSKWQHFTIFGILFLLVLWMSPDLRSYLANADHGYQLSMGKQILLGKFPFVDLFFHYGPLTAFTSAFGLWISDSLVPETVICALGYATALFLIHYLTKAYVSVLAGWLTLIAGFLLLARFYKWYYWLFPLLALYCFHRILSVKFPYNRKWFYLAGFFGGIGGLYRLDLGIAILCFYVVILLGLGLKPLQTKVSGRHLAMFLIGFCLPFLIWFFVLWGHGGSVQDYFRATFAGGKGAVEKLSVPFPTPEWRHPLSKQSRSALVFLLFPLSSLLCLCLVGWKWFRRGFHNNPKDQFMAAVGLLGIGIFPQALHRSDIPHLLQVLPPGLIAVSLIFSELWSGSMFSKGPHHGRLFLRIVAVWYLIIAGVAGWEGQESGRVDLVKWNFDPLTRYTQLRQGIHSGLHDPIISLMQAVQNRTRRDESILVVPWTSQLYYFADRPLSGVLNVFAPGVLDDTEWRLRNLAVIKQKPPSVVIVKEGFFSLPPTDWFRISQPELYAFLSTRYTRICYAQDGWMLLKKSS